MNIIHCVNGFTTQRLVQQSLVERLAVMPAVVLTGARQTGKSTLVRELLAQERTFFTLDDLDVAAVAREDPSAITSSSAPITIDEIQREPGLLLAVKRQIDNHRKPGRFLLTGSANLLLMEKVSESLAGRASYLTLWPMTRREQLNLAACGIWSSLLDNPPQRWLEIVSSQDITKEDWRKLALRGGFPVPALHLKRAEQRRIWFDGYVRTYLERDLRQISAVDALPDFRRLMRAVCHRMGNVVNQTELGRDVSIPQPTVHRYLNLLETSYMLIRLPAYSVNRTKRLIKAPKYYWSDTGLALFLSGREEAGGEHLENLVLNDLVAWRDSATTQADLFYWRTTLQEEVDFVIEAKGRLLPIEVKATSRPRVSDAASLRSFLNEYRENADAGLLLHTGDRVEWLTANVLAAPWWRVI
jgi:predicted AAA+ superfamily ATPase